MARSPQKYKLVPRAAKIETEYHGEAGKGLKAVAASYASRYNDPSATFDSRSGESMSSTLRTAAAVALSGRGGADMHTSEVRYWLAAPQSGAPCTKLRYSW